MVHTKESLTRLANSLNAHTPAHCGRGKWTGRELYIASCIEYAGKECTAAVCIYKQDEKR